MRFSVITINCNNMVGLERTLDSVLCQSCSDFEWIVIDGGSTDGSRQLIERYANRLAYWVSEPDDGVYHAMNKGIVKAKGDYVIFMNSGDCFVDAEVLKDVSKELDCDIVAGFVKENDTKKTIKPPLKFTPWHVFHQNVPHQAEFIKLSLFDSIALYSEDLKVLSDLEFNFKASMANVSYKVIQRPVALVEPGGISNTQIDLMEQERELIKERNLPKAFCEDFSFWMNNEHFISYPSIQWAIEKKWPLKLLNFLNKLF